MLQYHLKKKKNHLKVKYEIDASSTIRKLTLIIYHLIESQVPFNHQLSFKVKGSCSESQASSIWKDSLVSPAFPDFDTCEDYRFIILQNSLFSIWVCSVFPLNQIQVMPVKQAIPEVTLHCLLSGGMLLVCPVTDLNSLEQASLPDFSTGVTFCD